MSWLDRLKGLAPEGFVSVGHLQNPQNIGFEGFDGTVETHIPSPEALAADEPATDDDAREAWEERAAIMEFDGELMREEAERQATALMSDVRQTVVVCHGRPAPDASDWGDLRPCTWCRNLTRSGRCLAAWRGELRAAREYEPTFPGQPQWCIGYDPKADDPIQTQGRDRWPELVTWQGRPEAVTPARGPLG